MRYFILIACFIFSNAAFAQATKWFPFENTNGHIRIPVTVAGIDTFAIIDSGSQVNAINLAFMEEHGLEYDSHQRINIKGAHGVKERKIYREIPTTLVGLDLNMEMVGIDLGHHQNGILLGAPVLNQFVLQFNYPEGKMRIAAPGTFNLREVGNLEMRAQKGSGQPLVKVNLNNEIERWLLLDTGNSGGIYMERIVATSYDWLKKYPSEMGLSRGVNEVANVEYFQLPTLGFGPYTLENIRVVVPAEGEAMDFGDRYSNVNSRTRGVKISGILGHDVLKHFILTLDYNNGLGHVYVAP
ncbi:hypothetical protein IDAT_06165 [Pseudidiomarina atlantica]|jgi:hypothetical protein|uniref:Signal protein PDZ n=1 Tax=Pseudidiomarina atlantica TaxID=1517416 RepID=A0A094J879_9GAMM|nr:aspartyl protease family protein [Pseudidiomarina atlantica]KFZ28786.1 hypothetical protein IDAT_06165 [Pseudidiomarina atlantica]